MRYRIEAPNAEAGAVPPPPAGAASGRGLLVWPAVSLLLGLLAGAGADVYAITRAFSPNCDPSLRVLHVAYRRLRAADRTPERFPKAVMRLLADSFLVTEKDSRYLGSRMPRAHYMGPCLEVLLCGRDPDYARKLPTAIIQQRDPGASLILAPTPEVLARCPYHLREVLRDGRVVPCSASR